jgi:hypothetical protein
VLPVARARRDLPPADADLEAQAAEDLFALTRLYMASVPGTEAAQINAAIRKRRKHLVGRTAHERLDELLAFVQALGAGDAAERWIESYRQLRQRVQAQGPEHG